MNKRRTLNKFLSIASLGLALLLLGCTSDLKVSNTDQPGSGVGSETVGIIYKSNLSLADGAQIKIIKTDVIPDNQKTIVTDSQITNTKGEYKLKNLPSGTYNIFGSKEGELVYRSSVEIKYDSAGKLLLDTLRDTLQLPGSLTGTISLMPGDDPRKVLVLILGSSYTFAPDTNGKFTLENLPRGTYPVRFYHSLPDYEILDTVLTIISGKITNLANPIILKYKGIPAVNNVKTAYDSVKQIVQITWNKAPRVTMKGYNVFRDNVDSSQSISPINTKLLTDTFFIDSNIVQGRTYKYRIVSADTVGKIGIDYAQSDSVKMSTAFKVARTIGNTFFKEKNLIGGKALVVIQDKIFVSFEDSSKIAVFDTLGNFKYFIVGQDSLSLRQPQEMAAYNNRLYVADMFQTSKIVSYSLDGNFLSQIGYNGYNLRDFSMLDSTQAFINDNDENMIALIGDTVVKARNAYSILGTPAKIGLRGNLLYVDEASKMRLIVLDTALNNGKVHDTLYFNDKIPSVKNCSVDGIQFKNDTTIIMTLRYSGLGRVLLLSKDGDLLGRFFIQLSGGNFGFAIDTYFSNNKLYVLTSQEILVYSLDTTN